MEESVSGGGIKRYKGPEAGSVSAVSEQQQGGRGGLSRSSEGRVRTEAWQGADHLKSGGYRIWAK